MRGWLRRFRGVATKHLANYLAWHRFLLVADGLAEELVKERLLMASFP
jgi:hypothetical protein